MVGRMRRIVGRRRRTLARRPGVGGLLLAFMWVVPAVSEAQRGGAPPAVRAGATERISEHVHVILDNNVSFVPNVGFVVGDSATMVVDTGLGVENAQTILDEARALAPDNDLVVVSTHFHPEHALGEAGFPDGATIIRSAAQQQDIDEFGAETVERFKTFSAANAEYIGDSGYREADRIFESETTIDLGGVTARVFWEGPTHTRGDTMVLVEEDAVLFAGDVVMTERFVSFNSEYSSLDAWLEAVASLERMEISQVVPAHGRVGDAGTIGAVGDYLTATRDRVTELKTAGRGPDEAASTAATEVAARFDGLTGSLQGAAQAAYREAD